MPKPFDSININSLTLPNRFVRSATWEAEAADDGSVTPALRTRMAGLARGEVGLIISGHATVSREGQAGMMQLGAYADALIPGLTEMTRAVHEAGGRIALQLAHAGTQAATSLSGLPAVGPSVPPEAAPGSCRALDHDGISDLVAAFAQAAVRARQAGFDAVQIHGAHGYLLSQFLSPAWNQRTDEYGGSVENRARFILEVAAAVRVAVGPDYPVLAKINSEDFVPGGVVPADAVAVAAMLEAAGVDAVELSGGCRQAGPDMMAARKGYLKSAAQEVYYREAARLYKEKVGIPLILVGGIRSIEVAEDVLASGLADCISLSRPLICEPELIKRWHGGDRSRALCVSDNACYGPAFAGEGVRCVTFEKKRAKAE